MDNLSLRHIRPPSGLSGRRSSEIDELLTRWEYDQSALIEILHALQERFNYLDRAILGAVAQRLKLPPSLVYGVASFYHEFRLSPPGTHQCLVCTGTSCHIKGGGRFLRKLEQRLEIPCGSTTSDGNITLRTVRCLGTCDKAPLMVLDGVEQSVDPDRTDVNLILLSLDHSGDTA